MPDLSNHSNIMAEEMVRNPDIYDKLKGRKTKMGVTLAKCMKPGVDNPGHVAIKSVGLVAGDEESYETFKELFDPVIDKAHHGFPAHARHRTDLNHQKLSTTRIDPTCNSDGQCKYVMTSRVLTGRSVRGMRLPPAIGFEERRELERVLVKTLLKLDGDLKGDYYPLRGSKSYRPKPNGMTQAMEEELRSCGNLFKEPDSTELLSSGSARHWPDARGIFFNGNKDLFVWVNEEDHLRIVSTERGDGIRKTFIRFATACTEVQKALQSEGKDFMHNDHHGYILTCPSNLGTGLRAGAQVKLPLLSARKDFKAICAKMQLQARVGGGVDSGSTGGLWDISNADRLGKSEVQLTNIFIEGVAQMIKWEQMLEKGKTIDKLLPA